jgi:hypothetical protein
MSNVNAEPKPFDYELTEEELPSRELTDDGLDQVTGGVVVTAIIAVLIGLLPPPPPSSRSRP